MKTNFLFIDKNQVSCAPVFNGCTPCNVTFKLCFFICTAVTMTVAAAGKSMMPLDLCVSSSAARYTPQTSSWSLEKEQNTRLQIYRDRGHAYFPCSICNLSFLRAVEKKMHRRRTHSPMPHRECGNSCSFFHVPDFCRRRTSDEETLL